MDFYSATQSKILDQISDASKALVLKTMGPPLHSDQFQSHLEDHDFQIFYHAPVLILISANAEGPEVIEDCALAAENLMLAAYAAGLGTYWIGVAQNCLNSADGKRLLGVPPAWVSVAPIIVGHHKSSTPVGSTAQAFSLQGFETSSISFCID